MKLTRSVTEPDGLGATHVLAWFPPYLISSGQGCWDLQTVAEYDAGTPVTSDDRSLFAARNATPGELAGWAAGQLGSPVVMLEKSHATFTSISLRERPRIAALGRREPVWYLRPARDAVPPELQAEVLAALQLRPRPGLYVDRAHSAGNAGCLLVVQRAAENPQEAGRIIGLAVPVTGWRLGCTRCGAPITEDDSQRGWCRGCTSDRNEAGQ
jgi:hypothetical protein